MGVSHKAGGVAASLGSTVDDDGFSSFATASEHHAEVRFVPVNACLAAPARC
jgi:hypothetical protein